ncbi:hypothetical protein BC834DRAFT_293136 [Gloeopeniophorella convolvens]|nr:hypothetical protein BC834DRAFT_293136 [Gloeopeniophorella convolvens]
MSSSHSLCISSHPPPQFGCVCFILSTTSMHQTAQLSLLATVPQTGFSRVCVIFATLRTRADGRKSGYRGYRLCPLSVRTGRWDCVWTGLESAGTRWARHSMMRRGRPSSPAGLPSWNRNMVPMCHAIILIVRSFLTLRVVEDPSDFSWQPAANNDQGR